MQMRGWSALMLAVWLGGCASAPTGPASLPSRQLASIQQSELAGMTQDDLRERVGLKRTGYTLAAKARLDGNQVVSEVWAMHVVPRVCHDAPEGYWASTDLFPSTTTTLQMVDGRIVRMDAPGQPYGSQQNAEHPFMISCRYSRKMTFQESMCCGQAGALALLPLAPAVLASKAIGEGAESYRYAAFAELRLGETPPGGLDAWLKRHKGKFKASSPREGETEIRFNVGEQSATWQPAAARFKDGRVEELNPRGACILQDRSLDCRLPH